MPLVAVGESSSAPTESDQSPMTHRVSRGFVHSHSLGSFVLTRHLGVSSPFPRGWILVDNHVTLCTLCSLDHLESDRETKDPEQGTRHALLFAKQS